ncbi:PBP1A family penicillin-binding protein [Enterococcus alishanensis]
MANRSRSNQSHGTSTKVKKGKKTRKSGSIILKILTALVGLVLIGVLGGIGVFAYYAKDAEPITEKSLDSTASSKFYDINGNLFEDIGSENREKATSEEIPQRLDDAIVSVEDQRFYKHHGIDPIRIAGSLIHNITNSDSGGLQGGSTLTQQLVKLSVFSTKASDQTLKRKAQEAWLATRLEKEKSKQEILTYYINKVYMGNGLYGMKTASETYYGKNLSDLSIAETALLAGLPQAPNSYEPYEHAEAAKKRRDTVLYTMLENDKITQSEYDEAVATDIQAGLQPLNTGDNTTRKIVDNYLTEVINQIEEETDKDVYTDGLEVHTNLNMDQQTYIYNLANNTDGTITYPDDDFQVAATMVDVNTGNVTAQIGGRNIADDVYLGFNQAVSTDRDLGSTVKPITDYGPAFEYLQYSTGATITDAKYNYPGTKTAVNNWDNSYMGTITLRQALYDSRNVPAVKLFEKVGADKSAEFLNGLGIQYKDILASNAISSNTETQEGTKYGISTEKMAAAYAAFSNGGTYYKPSYIDHIEYLDGTTQSFSSAGQKAMEESTAYMVTDVLKDVITKGSGTYASIYNVTQAGKTGTSNYSTEELAKIPHYSTISPDVSFTGYTTNYALSVWTGYSNRMTPITTASENIAQLFYRNMMQYVSQDQAPADWTKPSNVSRVGGELYINGSTASNSVDGTSYNNYYNNSTSSYNNYYDNSSSSSSAAQDYNNYSSSSVTGNETVPSSSVNNGNTNNDGTGSSTPPVDGGGDDPTGGDAGTTP